MEKSELLDLIPLFVTGKLSDGQRAAIERELSASQEVRDEIAFWRAAGVAAHMEAGYRAAGHLPGKRIVDYARGAISAPLERLEIERHLQICRLCSNDFETVKPAFVQPAPVPDRGFFQGLIRELTATVRSVGKLAALKPGGLAVVLRPIYVLPLVAVVVVSGAILYHLANPPAHPISFALQFRMQDRSPSAIEHQTLSLPPEAGIVHLSVPIPHATLQPNAEGVVLTLASPAGKLIQLNHGLVWSVGNPFDTVKVEVAASDLHTSGVYVLHAAIKYTSTSAPFEYSYRFGVANSAR